MKFGERRWVAGYLALAALGGTGLGCATQQATSQAMTIAGAAAVIVGASMAADNNCNQVTTEGPAPAFCSGGLSRGARNAGTAIAVAGAGVAAAGYALQPKGPDRLQGGANALPPPATPYRLVRPAPEFAEPEPVEAEAEKVEPPAAPSGPACPPSASKPSEEAAEEKPSEPAEAQPRCPPENGDQPPNGAPAPEDQLPEPASKTPSSNPEAASPVPR